MGIACADLLWTALVPHLSLQEVIRTACRISCGEDPGFCPGFDHQLSCDNDARAQEWIIMTQTPGMFVEQLREVADSVAWDKLTQKFCPVPSSKICVCSWVCHDV